MYLGWRQNLRFAPGMCNMTSITERVIKIINFVQLLHLQAHEQASIRIRLWTVLNRVRTWFTTSLPNILVLCNSATTNKLKKFFEKWNVFENVIYSQRLDGTLAYKTALCHTSVQSLRKFYRVMIPNGTFLDVSKIQLSSVRVMSISNSN